MGSGHNGGRRPGPPPFGEIPGSVWDGYKYYKMDPKLARVSTKADHLWDQEPCLSVQEDSGSSTSRGAEAAPVPSSAFHCTPASPPAAFLGHLHGDRRLAAIPRNQYPSLAASNRYKRCLPSKRAFTAEFRLLTPCSFHSYFAQGKTPSPHLYSAFPFPRQCLLPNDHRCGWPDFPRRTAAGRRAGRTIHRRRAMDPSHSPQGTPILFSRPGRAQEVQRSKGHPIKSSHGVLHKHRPRRLRYIPLAKWDWGYQFPSPISCGYRAANTDVYGGHQARTAHGIYSQRIWLTRN